MEFRSKVVGVSHDNADGTSRQEIMRQHCKPGKRLIVKPEPANKHDRFAVGLWVRRTKEKAAQIGYFDSETAKQVRGHMAKGLAVDVMISAVTGGTDDKPTLGVNIEVELTDDAAPVPRALQTSQGSAKGCFTLVAIGVIGFAVASAWVCR